MKERAVSDLAGLHRAVQALGAPERFLCFRGQGDAAWGLVPSLYRGLERWTPEVDPEEDGREIALVERDLYRDFKRRGRPHLGRERPGDGLEMLFVARHHGAPTRLLDWTRALSVAAYFAVTEAPAADATLWCLDVDALPVPEAALGRRAARRGYPLEKLRGALDVGALSFLRDTRLLAPPRDRAAAIPSGQTDGSQWQGLLCLIEPPLLDDRIKNQDAVFALYLSYDDEDFVWDHRAYLEAVERHHDRALLTAIRIPSGAKQAIRRDLETLWNVNPHALFPDLAGLVMLQQRQCATELDRLARNRRPASNGSA